jgi:hypothetical protein
MYGMHSDYPADQPGKHRDRQNARLRQSASRIWNFSWWHSGHGSSSVPEATSTSLRQFVHRYLPAGTSVPAVVETGASCSSLLEMRMYYLPDRPRQTPR